MCQPDIQLTKSKTPMKDDSSGSHRSKNGPSTAVVHDFLKIHFPGCLPGSATLNKVKPVVEALGLTDDNTLFAQSICPDEINHEEGDIPNLFADYFGEVFHLGGLAGIPFTGKTGFAAYSHHVPERGHCFVLLAPHIGVSDELKLGQYSRDGQACAGSACGAAVGALNHCLAGTPLPALTACHEDPQMAYIIHAMHHRKSQVLTKAAKLDDNVLQANLAKVTHSVAHDMLDLLTNVDFGNDATSSLFVLTGIQINAPRTCEEDFFQPLTFQVHRKDGSVTDLFEQTFGVASEEQDMNLGLEVDKKVKKEEKLTNPICSMAKATEVYC